MENHQNIKRATGLIKMDPSLPEGASTGSGHNIVGRFRAAAHAPYSIICDDINYGKIIRTKIILLKISHFIHVQ